MLNKSHAYALAAALFGALVLPGASAGSSNEIVQVGIGAMSVDDVVENEWELTIGYGLNGIGTTYSREGGGANGNAATNCQFLLAINTLVVNVVAMDALGLINDDDVFEGPAYRTLGEGYKGGHESATNGTSSCEQHIGAVDVGFEVADGWGEPAPIEAAGLADALQLPGNNLNGGGGNEVIQVGAAIAGVDDVVTNDADVSIVGTGNAAANCQVIIAWNTLVVNLGTIDQEGTIDDGDDVNESLPNDIAVTPLKMNEREEDEDVLVGGWASCVQTVDSIDLHIGEDDDTLPPQS